MQYFTSLRSFTGNFRALFAAPVSTISVALMIALGIGITFGIFSLVQALMLQPLHVTRPAELVRFRITGKIPQEFFQDESELPDLPLSISMFRHLEEDISTCGHAFAWVDDDSVRLRRDGVTRMVRAAFVSGSTFEALGLQPYIGRLTRPSDDRLTGGENGWAAVLSWSGWKNIYQQDLRIVGRNMEVNGIPVTVVGVLPQSFSTLMIGSVPELILPLRFPNGRWKQNFLSLNVFCRLQPGSALRQVRAEVQSKSPAMISDSLTAQQLSRGLFNGLRIDAVSAETGWSDARREYQKSLLQLQAMGVAIAILLTISLGIFNWTLLELRLPELTVRTALGARLSHILRQIGVESLGLVALSLFPALLVGRQTRYILLRYIADGGWVLPLPASRDYLLLGLASLAITAVVLIGSLVPTIFIFTRIKPGVLSRGDNVVAPVTALHNKSHLLLWQIACSTAIAFSCCACLKSFSNTLQERSGFVVDHTFLTKVDCSSDCGGESPSIGTIANRVEELRNSLGVAGVGLSQQEPLDGDELDADLFVRSSGGEEREEKFTFVAQVSPGYFESLGIPILNGHDFAWSDLQSHLVCIVNSRAAEFFFPGGNALDRILVNRSDPRFPECRVVGIVGNTKYDRMDEPNPKIVYFPIAGPALLRSMFAVVMRYRSNMPAAMRRHEIETLFPSAIVRNDESLAEKVAKSTELQTILAKSAVLLGLLSQLMSALAIHGTISRRVHSGTREIGVRMALGASRMTILSTIVIGMLQSVLTGFAIGSLAGCLLLYKVQNLLYGVRWNQPTIIVGTAIVMVGTALVAAGGPSIRAFLLDPARAIRSQ